MNACICCDSQLLRHLTRHRAYWFCPYCHQEMPSRLFLKCLSSNKIVKPKTVREQLNLV